MKRSFIGACVVTLMAALAAVGADYEADVVVYGATPAGISAVVQAKRMGVSAILIEPTCRIGGMTTGGLGQTDFEHKEAFGGIALEFYRAVRRWYADPSHWRCQSFEDYMPDGQCCGTKDGDTMWTFEPSAALAILEGWEHDYGLQIHRQERLDRSEVGIVKSGGSIFSIRMESGNVFHGKVFVDASYEGDLLAAAGVSYAVGREANSVYGETLNGIQRGRALSHQFQEGVDPYVIPGERSSGLLPGVELDVRDPDGAGDARVQAYCFRMCLTDNPGNRIPFARPDNYDESAYELMFREYEKGWRADRGLPWINSPMPNRKTDTNNRDCFSTDLIGGSQNYPEATYSERESIVARHLDYQRGLMWTLANHPRVPALIRAEVSKWGTCKDEFVGERGDGWQNQLYIRESRRMVGEYVMTEHECMLRRKVPHPVAVGSYGMDSHHSRRYVDQNGFVRNEGDIQHRILDDGRKMRPYAIDYGALLPKREECKNLLVPVCVSASHIAYGSIRMEPVFFALGQVAGTVASFASRYNCAVQDVDYSCLRKRLLADGQIVVPSLDPAEAEPCRIDAPENPYPWETTAVAEFRDHFLRICARGKVTVGGCDGVVFHIGNTEFAKSRGLSSNSFLDEEWAVRSFGRDVVLNGGGSRGCLYAVYHFLEDRCWVRWWGNGEVKLPRSMPIEMPPLNDRGRPKTRSRAISSTDDVDFRTLVRNRINSGKEIPLSWGGCVETEKKELQRQWDDFPVMRFHMLSHLLENPDADIAYAEADFLCQYYGRGAYAAALGERRAKDRGESVELQCLERFDLVRDGMPVADIVRCDGADDAVEFFLAETRKCGMGFRAVSRAVLGRSRIVFMVDENRLTKDEDAYSIDFPDCATMRISCSAVSARWAVNRILKDAFGIRWPFLPTMRKHTAEMEKYVGGDFNEHPWREHVFVSRKRIVQGPYSFWLSRSFDWRANMNRQIWDGKGDLPSHKQCADAFPAWKYAFDQSWPAAILPTLQGKTYLPPKAKKPLSGETQEQRFAAANDYSRKWNPCYSNPKTAEVAASNILARIEADHGKTGIYNLDINDIGGMCQCARCLASVGRRRTAVGLPDYSEVYYRYVNRVADIVCSRCPDARFSLIAYCSVLTPPPFKLHPHVIVRCCFELMSMLDENVHDARVDLIRKWSQCASAVEVWDYNYGISNYLLPRLNYSKHTEFLRELHDAGLRGLYSESSESPFDGPRHFIMLSLERDINANPTNLLREWCEIAVGKEASTALEAYFHFWDGYWSSQRVRSTPWFKSSRSTYLTLNSPTVAYALEKGDMAKCRALLEEVQAKCRTVGQKRRAKILLEMFSLAENAAKAIFAELLDADGGIPTPERALQILKAVPEACRALNRIKKNAFVERYGSADDVAAFQCMSLSGIAAHATDFRVKDVLCNLASNSELPGVLRGMFRAWVGSGGANLLENGSFEQENPLPKGWRGAPRIGELRSGVASDGCHSIGGSELMVGSAIRMKPGKTYIFMFDAYTKSVNPEGTINFQLSPIFNGIPRMHVKNEGLKLVAGKWQTFCGAASSGYREKYHAWDDLLEIHVYARNWDADDRVYVDNFRVYEFE